MAYCGIGYANLKKALRTATSKDFGITVSVFDSLLLVCFGLLAVGAICFSVRQEPLPMKMVSVAAGTICVLSLLLSYRMMVPFVLRITHADMLRVCRPFYVWLCCCMLVVCTSRSFLELFADWSGALLQVTLTILTAGLAIEHFRKGRTRYLFLSACAAGVVLGLSSFGVCALVLLFAIPFSVRHLLYLELEGGSGTADVEPAWVFERLINPSALSGVRIVMAVSFFLGAAASVFGKMILSGKGIRYLVDCFASEWASGLSVDGVALLVVAGIIPSLLVLSRIRDATDTMRFLNFSEQVRYFAVVCGVGVFLLLGDSLLRKMQVPIVVDARYGMLGTVIGGFSFLVAATVLLVDVWCRIPKNARINCTGRRNPVSRFCQLVLMILPVALVGVAAFLRARSVM